MRAAIRHIVARGDAGLPAPAVRDSRAFADRMLGARADEPGASPARAALVAERDRLLALAARLPAEAIAATNGGDRPADAGATARPHAGVAGFLIDVVEFVASDRDTAVRRLARSPFSGIPRADAAALAIAAGERSTYVETVERGAVPMGAVSSAAAHAFTDGLAACLHLYRAQGATARELVSTAALRFRLAQAGSRAEATLAAAGEEADALDAMAAVTQSTWSPAELARALRARVEHDLASAPAPADAVPAAAAFPRLEPEAAHDVRRRRSHFSASALNMYASCERKWFYRYVCAAVADTGSSASFYGTAFHWALERFHETVKRAGDVPPADLERDLVTWIGTAFARFRTVFETSIEYELQLRRARRTAKRYIAWFVARSRSSPFEVVGIETEAKMNLEGYDFIGYIDRLDRDDRTGGVTVVDYKTGSIARSAREYRKDVSDFLEFQLPFYYWARTAAGERVTRIALIPLKEATLDVQPVELEVVPVAASLGRFDDPRGTIGIDELTAARAKMIEYARRLTDAPIEHFGVTRDAEACGYCPYLHACRERPLAAADRFGR